MDRGAVQQSTSLSYLGFSTQTDGLESADFDGFWPDRHLLQVAETGGLFRFNLSARRIFVVADSIQSLLHLFDIKPCLARSAVGRDSLFTNSKFRRKTGKGYG